MVRRRAVRTRMRTVPGQNVLRAKPGFMLRRRGNRVFVSDKATGKRMGVIEVDCICMSGGGTCRIKTVENVLLCKSGTCSTCVLTVDFPSYRDLRMLNAVY